jgi:hypothetical protein
VVGKLVGLAVGVLVGATVLGDCVGEDVTTVRQSDIIINGIAESLVALVPLKEYNLFLA